MTTPRVLLLGGHGRVSLCMTPKIVARSWHLTSVTRNPEQRDDILQAGHDGPGQVEVLVSSLEDIKSQSAAQKILDKVKPDWVIWSAGAGGQGDVSRTYAIDRDASVHFTRAIMATPSITRYLHISAHSVRRQRASWWHDEEDYELWQRMYHEIIPDYHKAKHVAEDVLAVLGEERRQRDPSFQWVSLRPGMLGQGPAVGQVSLGRTRVKGQISREDVAEVAVALLAQGHVSGWVDLMNGEEDITSAVNRLAQTKETSMEGESLDAMKATLAKY